jgi:hypothetical protein
MSKYYFSILKRVLKKTRSKSLYPILHKCCMWDQSVRASLVTAQRSARVGGVALSHVLPRAVGGGL